MWKIRSIQPAPREPVHSSAVPTLPSCMTSGPALFCPLLRLLGGRECRQSHELCCASGGVNGQVLHVAPVIEFHTITAREESSAAIIRRDGRDR